MDNLFTFDLASPRRHSYVIIRYDETTCGVQAEARTEIRIDVELRTELPRDT